MNNVIWSHILHYCYIKKENNIHKNKPGLALNADTNNLEFKSLAEHVLDCEPQGVKLLPPAPWTISKPLVLVGRKNLKINDEGEND